MHYDVCKDPWKNGMDPSCSHEDADRIDAQYKTNGVIAYVSCLKVDSFYVVRYFQTYTIVSIYLSNYINVIIFAVTSTRDFQVKILCSLEITAYCNNTFI